MHIESASGRASIAISDGTMLKGDAPAPMVREACTWVELSRKQLIERWKEMHE